VSAASVVRLTLLLIASESSYSTLGNVQRVIQVLPIQHPGYFNRLLDYNSADGTTGELHLSPLKLGLLP